MQMTAIPERKRLDQFKQFPKVLRMIQKLNFQNRSEMNVKNLRVTCSSNWKKQLPSYDSECQRSNRT
eukprot:jgi/Phyca11/511026/fgenesh2_kg.PHYCAscaffold_72_\